MEAETLIDQTPEQPYVEKVYSALKENLHGFDKSPEQFKTLMLDRAYASKAYQALKDNLTDFHKSENDFYSQLSQKKNPIGNDLSNTIPSPPNGLNPFQSSPQSTDLSPVLPEHRDEVRQQQQDQTKQLSDRLQNITQKLDPEHQAAFKQAQELAAVKPVDAIRQPSDKELAHDAFMQTPVGKTLGAINYLSSRATKGTLQVAKGAAYLAQMAGNPIAAATGTQDPSIDNAFKTADENTNFGLTKGDQQRMADNPIIGNLGGLAEFIPSAAAAGETGGATFYLQGLGQGKEAMDQAEKQSGHTINPMVKNGFILGTGLVNGALMGDLGGNMFKSLPAGLRGDITASITANAIKDASGKELTGEVFKELLDNGAKTFTDKLAKGGVQALEGYKHAVTNLSALATANFALKKGVDMAGDKPVFNETAGNLASSLSDIATKQAPFFAIPSAVDAGTRLTPYSEYKNSVVENLMHDSSPENVEKTKQDITNYGQQHEWKSEEIQATTDHVDKIAQVAKSLPKNIPDAKVSDAVDLVLGRNKLQEELKQEQDTRKQLDPAVQDVVSPNEQMLTDKVEQANDKLRDIVTGTKTTYSKGIGEEEGKFFKTTDGKKEEISPSRYQLEVTERPTKNEQAEPTQELPAKTPTDETEGKETPVIPTDETTKNSPINPIENESTNEKGSQENGTKETIGKKENAISTEEKVVEPGEDKTEPESTKKEQTGISNQDVQEEKTKEGEAVKERTRKTKQEIQEAGKKLLESDDFNPNEFAEKIINKPQGASAEEQEALLAHKTALKNQKRSIEKQIDNNEGDITEHKVRLAQIKDLIDKNQQATEIIGNELGRSLGHRTEAMNEDFSHASVLRRAKMANDGKEVSDEEKAKLEKHTKRIEELEYQLSEKEKEVRDLAKNTKPPERKFGKTVTHESLRKEREEIKAEISKIARQSLGNLGANKIPVELIGPLAKLAKNYVEDGILTLKEVTEKIYNDIKEHFPEISKDDISSHLKDDFDNYVSEDNKNRLEKSKNRLNDKLDKLKDGTYHAIQRRKLAVDKDYLSIKADINREQSLINQRLEAIEFKNKSPLEKARVALIKWTRNVKLGGVGVLGKLAATGLTTAALKIPEELAGGAISLALPKLAKKSNVEGGVNVRALAKGYTEGIMQGMKDSYETLRIKKGGKSDIEALYGKADKLPAEAIEFLGHLHSAIKAPIKRMAFEYSLNKRTAKAAAKGVDVSDPVVQAKMAMDAYKDANKAIFMNSNALTNKISTLLNATTDEPLDKTLETIGKILVPFAKVSTNIALSAGRLVGGLPVGISQLLYHSISGGLKELSPEQTDLVLHNLKRGSIGGAAVLMGFFNPQNVGGFYQPGEKRDDKDVKAGHMKIFGQNIPIIFTEHPIFLAMQIGATFRRVMDHYTDTGKDDANWAASLAATAGLIDAFSYASEGQRVTEALGDSKKGSYFVGDFVKGNTIPQLVDETAKHMDTKDGSPFTLSEFNIQKRKTIDDAGIMEAIKTHIQSSIPGWRKELEPKGDNAALETKIAIVTNNEGDKIKLNPKQLEERREIIDKGLKTYKKEWISDFNDSWREDKKYTKENKRLVAHWKLANFNDKEIASKLDKRKSIEMAKYLEKQSLDYSQDEMLDKIK